MACYYYAQLSMKKDCELAQRIIRLSENQEELFSDFRPFPEWLVSDDGSVDCDEYVAALEKRKGDDLSEVYEEQKNLIMKKGENTEALLENLKNGMEKIKEHGYSSAYPFMMINWGCTGCESISYEEKDDRAIFYIGIFGHSGYEGFLNISHDYPETELELSLVCEDTDKGTSPMKIYSIRTGVSKLVGEIAGKEIEMSICTPDMVVPEVGEEEEHECHCHDHEDENGHECHCHDHEHHHEEGEECHCHDHEDDEDDEEEYEDSPVIEFVAFDNETVADELSEMKDMYEDDEEYPCLIIRYDGKTFFTPDYDRFYLVEGEDRKEISFKDVLPF